MHHTPRGRTNDDQFIAKITLSQDATYHDASVIADVIEGAGYDVSHLIDPEEDEPNLYVEVRAEADDG